MVKQLFVLGCPGSGKSTISRYIEMLARDRGWSARSINDYERLYRMFQADTECERFRPVAFGGFDILDPFVRDIALRELREKAQRSYTTRNELVLIEFSRCNYSYSLKIFGEDLLSDANFLFLDADIDTCIRRVHERAEHRKNSSDYFVSNLVIDRHCQLSNSQSVASSLRTDLGIADHKIEVLDSRGSIQKLAHDVKRFVDTVILSVPIGTRKPGRSAIPALLPGS